MSDFHYVRCTVTGNALAVPSVALVLLAAIAAPFALSALRDDPHLTPPHNARGGSAIVEPAATAANDVPSAG